ncbi:MUC19, partial [Lemmus lemmus]
VPADEGTTTRRNTSSVPGAESTTKAVTTGLIPATTVAPGSSNTEATTSTKGSETTHGEVRTGTTHASVRATEASGSSSTGVPTEAPGSQSTGANTEATTRATESQDTQNTTACAGLLPPAPVCHGPLGEEKSPGDTWTSNCHQCTCTEAQAVDCKPKECPSPPTCETG